MRNISPLFIVFIVQIFFSACTQVGSNNYKDNIDLLYIDIADQIQIKRSLKDEFKIQIYPIKIKGSSNILISGIDKLCKNEDNWVIFDKRTQEVCLLDSTYSFLKKISLLGDGPGEYEKIGDISVNQESGNILLLCPEQMKIMVFDNLGNFIKESRIMLYARNIECIGKEVYLFSDYSDSEINMYYLYLLDEKLIGIEHFKPYFKKPELTYSFAGSISVLSKMLLFSEPLNDTVELLKGEETIRKWIINFGDQQLPESVKQNNKEFLERGFKFAYLQNKVFGLNRHLIFTFLYNSRISNGIYDSDKNILFTNLNHDENKLNLWPLVSKPVLVDSVNNRIYFEILIEKIPEWLIENAEFNDPLVQSIKDLNVEEGNTTASILSFKF
jgi:hypothetical protein